MRPSRVEPPAPPAPGPHEAPSDAVLTPLPASSFAAAEFRIVTPVAGARLELARAGELTVALEPPRGEYWVALDGHPFRRLGGAPLSLGQLLLEDEELAPGMHRLVVVEDKVAAGSSKGDAARPRSIAATWFWVHDPAEPSLVPPTKPPSPGLVLLAPRGTFYGAEADRVPLEAFALAPSVFVGIGGRAEGQPIARDVPLAVSLGASGETSSLARHEGRGALVATARLPSGDIEIHVSSGTVAHSGAPSPWATLQRVVTVNRDVERPEVP